MRQSAKLLILVAGPFLALSTIGGLAAAYNYVGANDYFAQGLEYTALQSCKDQVNRDLTFAVLSSLALFAVAVVLRRRGGKVVSFLPYFYAVQTCLLVSRVTFSKQWGNQVEAFGVQFPVFLAHVVRPPIADEQLIVPVATLLLALLCAVLFRLNQRHRNRDPDIEWPSKSCIQSCTAAAFVAVCLGLGVNLSALLTASEEATSPYSVVFVTWDSTRADHLPSYGYTRPTTPHVDQLAREAVLFENAISQNNWTRPSYMSMLSGRYSWEIEGKGFIRERTLAEVLKNHGYQTFGYVQNPNLAAELDFDQGFDVYLRLRGNSTPQAMNRVVLDRIESLAGSRRPFFLFIHYAAAHWPYSLENRFVPEFSRSKALPLTPRKINTLMRTNGGTWDPAAPGADAMVRYIEDMYDASLRNTDEALGEIIAALKRNGLWEESLIIFNSDHGDEFNDRGSFGHAHANLHPELTFVPMLIRFPSSLGIPPARIAALAPCLDIYPTVLGIVGIPLPNAVSGQRLPTGQEASSPQRVVSSSRDDLVMLRTGDHGLLFDHDDGSLSFFNRAFDRTEHSAISEPGDDPVFLRLRAEAERWHIEYLEAVAGEGAGSTGLSQQLRRELERLGYFH